MTQNEEFSGLTALEASAIRLHEIYKSLLGAGFSSEEALLLIANMTKASPKGTNKSDSE